MITDQTLFKTLDGLQAAHGGRYRYPGAGRWTRHLDPDQLHPCSYGYHLARGPQVFEWLTDTIYEAEACPDHDVVPSDYKLVTCRVRLVRKLRWDDQVARLFAADCAEMALLGERASGREPDERSWAAVAAARAFARGEITVVARDAAWAAARAAAGDAAGDAAWAAAGAAAGAAARDAARDAAWDAAWDAARAAAWDAAGAAARDAAGAAAWDAARDAVYERFGLVVTGVRPPVVALYGLPAAV